MDDTETLTEKFCAACGKTFPSNEEAKHKKECKGVFPRSPLWK